MLVSHHPPCDYDRTFRVGRVRICVRCFGILIGIVMILIWSLPREPMEALGILMAAVLLPLPAVFDFTFHELNRSRSNNFRRLMTGILMGLALGLIIRIILDISVFAGINLILYIFLLEFGVAVILNRSGRLEELIRRYEQAVRKRP
nr:DUF2085 domain-containing protein [candidate division Zixibacteria bacterium]